jgi:Winged helix DNA-binding domain
MNDCRILAPGPMPAGGWPAPGPGWRFVTEDADILLVSAESRPDSASIDHLALPLLVVVDAEIAPDLLNRADGWLLPGDDAAMIGHVARSLLPGQVAGVADSGTTTTQQISALSAEARRIADALAELAAAADAEEPTPISAALVRRLIRLRRDRERHFPAEIFADPAWDMLLDLAAARLERVDVPVSSLCVAAAVPTTTALRWIRSLSEAGLLVRSTDPADARRAFIGLSDQAFDAVAGWLRRFSLVFALR